MTMQFSRGDEEYKTESYLLRLTPSQRKMLNVMAAEDGITVSEILRRGIDLYIRDRSARSQSSLPTGNHT